MTIVPRVVGTRDAAKYIGVSAWTIHKLVRTGELPVLRHGRGFRFDVHDLDAYIERTKKKNKPGKDGKK
jgi:excisionase family DNA binding protein